MNSYEKLIDECDKENIEVTEKKFKSTAKGLWKNNKIGISSDIDTIKEKYCILSEEYGHYKTTYGDILNQKDIRNRKQELIARRWGYEKICGLDKIADCIRKGAKNRYEVAELLNVTDEYFEKTIQYLKLKYGCSAYCKGILFIFEPNFGIISNCKGDC